MVEKEMHILVSLSPCEVCVSHWWVSVTDMPPGMRLSIIQCNNTGNLRVWEKKKSNRLVRDDLTWALVYGQRKMDFYHMSCSQVYRQEQEYYWQEVDTYFNQHLTDDLFKLSKYTVHSILFVVVVWMVAFTLKLNLNHEGTVTLAIFNSKLTKDSAWGLDRKVWNSATVSTCEPDHTLTTSK